jgi:hypothetical protein
MPLKKLHTEYENKLFRGKNDKHVYILYGIFCIGTFLVYSNIANKSRVD